GQQVQIAFHFQSNDDIKGDAGWYIDDENVQTGPIRSFINQPVDFENGFGDWSVDHGTWEMGVPVPLPETVISVVNAAGTGLRANCRKNSDSRLMSPEFTVPATSDNPRLRFWHWFSVWPGDFAVVEVSVSGGPWQEISPRFQMGGVVWTRPSY